MNTEIARKVEELKLIDLLIAKCEEEKKDACTEYRIVGKEDEQATHWSTGELLWEDEEKTIPKYRDKWDNVNIPEEELSDESRAKIEACDTLIARLRKMI